MPTAVLGACFGVAFVVAACSADAVSDDAPHAVGSTAPPPATPLAAPDWLVARSGDATTTFEVSIRSFNLSGRNLGLPARLRFAAGDIPFEARFDESAGLGPDFNGTGCTSCHVDNGRHGAPIVDGWLGVGPVVHLSAPGASAVERPYDLASYGTRLQTASTAGEPEARVDIRWEELPGEYPDGTPYSLRRPVVSIVGRDGLLPPDAEVSLRIPTQVAGPGLLEWVPTEDIVATADPDDLDSDGISGRVQWVPDGDQLFVGRHGWKAENHDLLHQTAGALARDMGIGTTLAPVDGRIELSDEMLADLAFYIEGLAIPAGRDVDDPDVIAGANHFESVGCSSCHTPTQQTVNGETPELGNLVIRPFTDLLLHDMGPGLADDRPVLAASGSEWRTAPLWGIGLLETVNGHVALLHDGRARSIEEAILWHGGEAEASVDVFRRLPADQRAQLLAFVESR